MDAPETQFTSLGGDRIAYQVFGDRPRDLLYVGCGFLNSVDAQWEWPPLVRFFERLASFSRVIMFDRRGIGASDPVSSAALPTMEEWADEVEAVLDAAASPRATVFGAADAGPAAILFAAAHPERTAALILANTSARVARGDDYPHGLPADDLAATVPLITEMWGTERLADLARPTRRLIPRSVVGGPRCNGRRATRGRRPRSRLR